MPPDVHISESRCKLIVKWAAAAANNQPPSQALGPHVAPLGMMFYTGAQQHAHAVVAKLIASLLRCFCRAAAKQA